MLTLSNGKIYNCVGLINEGVYARVFRYINTEERLAVKILGFTKLRLSELDVLCRVAPQCPYLLSPQDIVVGAHEVYIVTAEGFPFEKFYQGGTHHDVEKITPLITNPLRLKFICELIWAVHHLHTQGILHLDIKPHNCIFYPEGTSYRLKLGDFGFAQYLHTPPLVIEERFSLKYAPNERVLAGYKGAYGVLDDIWTLGMTILRFIGVPAEFEREDYIQVAKAYEDLLHPDKLDNFMDRLLTTVGIGSEYHADLKFLFKHCLAPRDRRSTTVELLPAAERLAGQLGLSLPSLPRSAIPVMPLLKKADVSVLNSVVDGYVSEIKNRMMKRHHLLLTLDTFYRLYLVLSKQQSLSAIQWSTILRSAEQLVAQTIGVCGPSRDSIPFAKLLDYKLYNPVWSQSCLDFETLFKGFQRIEIYLANYYAEPIVYPPRLVDAFITK